VQANEHPQYPVVRPPDHLTHEQVLAWCDRFMQNPEFVDWLRRGNAEFGVPCTEVFDHLVVYTAGGEITYQPR